MSASGPLGTDCGGGGGGGGVLCLPTVYHMIVDLISI